MSTTKQTTRKYPAPVYAAAAAGDIAYQTLRTLPAKLRDRNVDVNIDVDKLRAVARRNAAAFVAGAQAAQEKAVAIYTDLVARGEQVVAGGARTAEATVAEIADHAEKDAVQTAKATKPAKAVKSTRPTAGK
jgi:heparin binding hemagglutinin HbhA